VILSKLRFLCFGNYWFHDSLFPADPLRWGQLILDDLSL
jgi:hypothetical protein